MVKIDRIGLQILIAVKKAVEKKEEWKKWME